MCWSPQQSFVSESCYLLFREWQRSFIPVQAAKPAVMAARTQRASDTCHWAPVCHLILLLCALTELHNLCPPRSPARFDTVHLPTPAPALSNARVTRPTVRPTSSYPTPSGAIPRFLRAIMVNLQPPVPGPPTGCAMRYVLAVEILTVRVAQSGTGLRLGIRAIRVRASGRL